MSNNSRTLLAVALSLLTLVLWQNYFFESESLAYHKDKTSIDQVDSEVENTSLDVLNTKITINNFNAGRVIFNNSMISGSINLLGARIDNLVLHEYRQEVQKDSHKIALLSPSGTKEVYYTEFGWLSSNKDIELPSHQSVWTTDKKTLNPNDKITLSWKNHNNIEFIIMISLDNYCMFTIDQKVIGLSAGIVKPYAAISRGVQSNSKSEMLIHEGGIGVFDNKLKEIKFDDLDNKKHHFIKSNNAWFGFSDKYWLTAIIPQKSLISTKFLGYKVKEEKRYQIDGIIDHNNHYTDYSRFLFFAGAKKLKLLDHYKQKHDIHLFDRAVDLGILYFITKPIFLALNFFHSLVKNFGIAIILLTISIKILLFPLAYKGFKGMNKLKEIQPKIHMLSKLSGGDKGKLQKSIIELYKKEKVNPMSGCLPVILQMPIFFALYKVLYVTLEMRHATFCLWIDDLSAIDPTNIFTLFGLVPWNTPSFLHVGILPMVMALTLYGQQMLNPQPADPTQAKVMKLLPLIFLFMFASFPSGLVLYWSCSNIFSIIQQLLIKRMTR